MNTKIIFTLVCLLIIILLIKYYFSFSKEAFETGKESIDFIEKHDKYYTEWFKVFEKKRSLIYRFIKKVYRKCDNGPPSSILLKTIKEIEQNQFGVDALEIEIMKKILEFKITEFIKNNEYKKIIPKNLIKLKAKLTQILLDEYTFIYKGFTHLPCEYYVNNSCPLGETSFCKKYKTEKGKEVDYNSVCVYKTKEEIETNLNDNFKKKYGDNLGEEISAHVLAIYKNILKNRECKMFTKYGKVYCENHVGCEFKVNYCLKKEGGIVPTAAAVGCAKHNSIYFQNTKDEFNKKKTDCNKDANCDFFQYPIKKKSLFNPIDNSENFGLCLNKTDAITDKIKKNTDYLYSKFEYCNKDNLGTDYTDYHRNSKYCHIDCEKMNEDECDTHVNNCYFDKYTNKCKDRCDKIKEASICNLDSKPHCYWEDGGYTGRCIDILSKNKVQDDLCKAFTDKSNCNSTDNCYWDRYENECKVSNNLDVVIDNYLDTNLAKELLGL